MKPKRKLDEIQKTIGVVLALATIAHDDVSPAGCTLTKSAAYGAFVSKTPNRRL